MNDSKFKWNDAKAASNIADHGVTFEAAREAFVDPFALDRLDESEDHGEDRYAMIGMVEGRVLAVAYMDARRSDPHHFGQRSRAA